MTGNYALRRLIEDLRVLQRECDPEGADNGKNDTNDKDNKLDSFEVAKRDLNFIMVDLKQSVEKRNEMVQSHGQHEQTIRLKSENEKMLTRAKEKFNEMRRAYDNQMKRKRKRLSDDILADRKKFVDMFENEIKDVETLHERRRARQGSRRSLAHALQETRRKKREDDLSRGELPEAIEMKQMTPQTQAFMEEKDTHDAMMGEKLNHIQGGIQDLHEIAVDMQTEMKAQDVILDQTKQQFNVLDDHFKTANQRMNRLLAESGGATRWCILMIAFVILLALVAYIFNLVDA